MYKSSLGTLPEHSKIFNHNISSTCSSLDISSIVTLYHTSELFNILDIRQNCIYFVLYAYYFVSESFNVLCIVVLKRFRQFFSRPLFYFLFQSRLVEGIGAIPIDPGPLNAVVYGIFINAIGYGAFSRGGSLLLNLIGRPFESSCLGPVMALL